MPVSTRSILAAWLWLLPGVLVPVGATEPGEFFERRVRPILVANCLHCHGEKMQESDLRLDSRDAILRGGAEGPAAVAGDASASSLVQAIRWDGERKMPPERKLRDDEIAVLTEWVQQGLPWPETAQGLDREGWRRHWSFQPIRRPAIPNVSQPTWPRTPIDRFIMKEWDRVGLQSAAEADRQTLLRRAAFDLLGLPPTPSQREEFLADRAPDAWERLLARLLASPRYGERWGRHWLDVARYADTKGYVFFEEKTYPWAYTYRDYVIESLNRDLPYDRFVLEQVAADRLPEADPRSLTALGFLTVGAHFMNNTHDIIDDRIDVVTRGVLGLTVTCARCHDHKYDPITAADYYALYGVFRSSREPPVLPTFAPMPANDEATQFAARQAELEKQLLDFVTQKHEALIEDARVRVSEYLLAAYQQRDQPATDDFMLIADTGDLNPTMTVRWKGYLAERKEQADPVWVPWHALGELPAESFSQQAGEVLSRLAASAPAVHPQVLTALQQAPLGSMQDVAQRYGELLRGVDQQWRERQKGAASAGSIASAPALDPPAEALRQVLYGPGSPPDLPLALDWGFLSLFPDRATQGEFEKRLKELEKWLMTGPGAPPRAMVLLDSSQPHEPRVFLRGNPHRLGPAVPRRFLAALGGEAQPFREGSGRRELAQALVAPDNPLTARVIVNRVWAFHFGEGLVRTPSDFGLRSEPPTHPELLDWLAAEFMERGWSLKWLHQEIMRSAVYRQSSVHHDAASARRIDAENRLLWRAPGRRLEFESQRDSLLAVADSLDGRLGGPAVDLLGDQLVPRRTVYGRIDRMDVPTLLTTFDFPNPLTTSPQRDATTVAPQALYAMNSRFVAEIAGRLIARPEVASLTETEPRVRRLYLLCYGREPTAEELAAAQSYLGERPEGETWRRLAHAFLLANEFLFVD